MRCGVFSDVHGNLEAFEAVLKALSKERIDTYLYVGDVVGYGADPRACIALLKKLQPSALIAGNHEWGVLGLLDLDYFNEYAEAAIQWTRHLMTKDELEYLKSFGLLFEAKDFTLVHGSLGQPARFNYILDSDDAELTLKLSRTPLTFVGHSHAAGFFCFEDGVVRQPRGPKFVIQSERKYVVNVGSVGQPRDGDPRAAYVIYDDKERSVEIKRVEYNVKAAQDKIGKAGLPAWLASRLAQGR